MTNQTQLDYLFKLTAAPSDRGASGAAGSSSPRPAFDDHLVQASTSALGSSPNSAGERATFNDSSHSGGDGSTSGTRTDDDYAARNNTPVDHTGPTDTVASDETHAGAAGGHEANGAQSGGQGATGHVADSENENDSDKREADELAGAALVDAKGTLVRSQEQATRAEDILAEGAVSDAAQMKALGSTSSDSANARQHAGDAAENLEIETSATHKKKAQASDSSLAQTAGELANASESRESQARNGANANHLAGELEAGPGQNVNNAESRRAKRACRRSMSESDKSADELRRGDARTSQRADAKTALDHAAALMAPNSTTAQAANSAATTEAGQDAARAAKTAGQNTVGLHATARAQRAGVAATRRGHGSATPDLPRVDVSRFVGRVAKAVQTAQERGGTLQLRLSPPELGSLRLELTMQNGVMTASVETDNPVARQVLLDHLPALRERLAEQNISIERFDVDVRQENSGGQADPRASQQDHRQHQSQQPHSRHPAGRSAATQPTTDQALPTRSRLIDSELNLLA
jgi:flagellar hook-length control protein FliK